MGQLSLELDRSSPVPLYYQVAQQIERAIETGALVPGDKLDNEIRLADRLGLSRPTMRRAIEELVGKGLLVRKRGVGTQVVHGMVHRKVELTSLYDDLERAGQQPTTEVLAHASVPADATVAAALQLPQDTEVVHLERLRSTKEGPLALMRNWLPASVGDMSTEDLRAQGLYKLLRAAGYRPHIAHQRITARSAGVYEARILGVRRGSPLLRMARTAYDEFGRAVEYGDHHYIADTYAIEVTVVDR
jgi:DNA-binding GntR family transcriptional regulator